MPAKGVVKYKGAPIAKISVVFTPSDGKGMIANGLTDAKGEFALQTNAPGDGAMVGNYTVSFRYDSGEIPDMFAPKKETSPIPEKYSDASKSGHTAKVDADKSKNNFPFDLQ